MFSKSGCTHSFEKTISYSDDTKSTVLSITYFCDGCGMMRTERFLPPCDHELETYISFKPGDPDWDINDESTITKICNLCGDRFTTVVDGAITATILAEPKPEQHFQPPVPTPEPPEPPPTRIITEGKPTFRRRDSGESTT